MDPIANMTQALMGNQQGQPGTQPNPQAQPNTMAGLGGGGMGLMGAGLPMGGALQLFLKQMQGQQSPTVEPNIAPDPTAPGGTPPTATNQNLY